MKLLILAPRSRNMKAIPARHLANAQMVVGKDRTVLRDTEERSGIGHSLTVKELEAITAEAEEVITI